LKKLVLVPHKMGSRAARDLAAKLSEKVGHKVWRVAASRVGKRIPFTLRGGTDKVVQFNKFKEANVSIPECTTDRNVASGWLSESAVVARTITNGSEGRGIVLAETADQLVNAPLYTKYFKKKKEFRVHVFNGQVIDVAEKRKKKDHADQREARIRNLANGYVFCREGLVEPPGLRDLAIRATAALGYNLGAVDIAWNEHHDKLVVFEVNANPGLQGTTLENYANAITGWYRSQQRAV
jgi:glutathione synthase/RimK-type ligase-like ATP-grasp enzyme